MPSSISFRTVSMFQAALLATLAGTLPRAHAKPFNTPVTEGEQVATFVPSGYEIEDRLDGDLNADQRPDAVLVLIETAKGDQEAVRERALLILFAKESGFSLAGSSEGLVSNTEWNGHLAARGGASLSIKKGTLSISEVSGSSGEWHQSINRFRYNPESKHFLRIGTDESYGSDNSGERTTISTNLLTSVRLITEKPARYDDLGKPLPKRRAVVTRTRIEKMPLRTLESLGGSRE